VQVGHTVSANYKGKQLAHEAAVNRVFINVWSSLCLRFLLPIISNCAYAVGMELRDHELRIYKWLGLLA